MANKENTGIDQEKGKQLAQTKKLKGPGDELKRGDTPIYKMLKFLWEIYK